MSWSVEKGIVAGREAVAGRSGGWECGDDGAAPAVVFRPGAGVEGGGREPVCERPDRELGRSGPRGLAQLEEWKSPPHSPQTPRSSRLAAAEASSKAARPSKRWSS